MEYYRPGGMLAGFHSQEPDPGVPELVAVGEQWVTTNRPMDWHSHAEWELHLQIDGMTCRADARHSYAMRPGNLFISPPGASHRVINQRGGNHHYAFVRFRLEPVLRRQPQLANRWRLRTCAHLADAEAMHDRFRQLIREVVTGLPYRSAGIRTALDGLVLEASRLMDPAEKRSLLPLRREVHQAKGLLENHCERDWSVAALAHACGLSANHFAGVFKAHLGVSPHHYLLQRRIDRAKHLLAHTDAAVTAIAIQLGFATSQSFARVFRRLAGRTAREYRAAASGDPAEPAGSPRSARTRAPR